MNLIGIPLRKPSFGEVTASTIMGAGLWVAAVGLLQAVGLPLGAGDAGALLLVMLWGCIGARLGIHVHRGHRHLAANLLGGALLLGLYQAAWALA